MISDNKKKALLGNVELIKFCKEASISLEKLSECRVEKMWEQYVFCLRKENPPKSKCLIPLDVDIATQPDVVLIMTVTDTGFEFETTDKTIRVVNK